MTVTRNTIDPGTAEGQVATWDDTRKHWEPGPPVTPVDPAQFVDVVGDTMTGTLVLNGDAAGLHGVNTGGQILLLYDPATKNLWLQQDMSLSTDHLKKVSTVTPTTGWVLTWNGSEYVPQVASAGTLEGLSNVEDTPPTVSGDYLRWNGTAWDNATFPTVPTTLESLTNVEDTAPTVTGDYLRWSGSQWDNAAPSWLPLAGGTLTGTLTVPTLNAAKTTITITDPGALVVRDGLSSLNVLVVDTTNKEVELRNSAKLLLWSDNGTTTKGNIDAASGNITLLGNASFDHLTKVSLTAPTTGWVLTWNGTEYVPQVASGGGGTLEGLSNVADPAPVLGELLQYTGSAWDGVAPSTLGHVAKAGDTMTGQLVVNAEPSPLLLRKADATTTIVLVDAAGPNLSLRNATDLVMARDNVGSNPSFRIDGQNGGIYTAGTSPTITTGANGGSGETVAIAWGTDTVFQAQITGGTGAAIGTVAHVTFATARDGGTYTVVFQGASANGAFNPYVYSSSRTTAGFDITMRFAMSSGSAYYYECFVIGMGA
jgi:hypothetical protein